MNSPHTFRLAVIDSDSGAVAALAKRVEPMGWRLYSTSVEIAPEGLVSRKLDALLIDPAALGDQAWDYLEQVRARLSDFGLIVCTEHSTVAQRVRGLRAGIDDWIAKPYHPAEAAARLEAVTRQSRRGLARPDIALHIAGELEIRPDLFQTLVGGKMLDLTRREFEVLQLFAESDGRVLEREAIYRQVWGYAMAHGDRSVDVFVRKLRRKLQGSSPDWRYIHTHFGIGYRFDPVPAPGVEAEASAGTQMREESLAVA